MPVERLMEGNARFRAGADRMRQEELSRGQSPFACVVTCSDSRVPPELIFDASAGDIFVVRTAGNMVAGPVAMGSVEYAVAHLNVPLVLILGHSDCGAVKAALADSTPGGHCGTLVDLVREMGTDGPLEELVKRNVTRQRDELLSGSRAVREAAAEGRLSVRGAVYDIRTGDVRLL